MLLHHSPPRRPPDSFRRFPAEAGSPFARSRDRRRAGRLSERRAESDRSPLAPISNRESGIQWEAHSHREAAELRLGKDDPATQRLDPLAHAAHAIAVRPGELRLVDAFAVVL